MLADWFFMPESAVTVYHNVLYIPAAHALALVWPFGGPLGPLYALSVLPTASAVGVIYLCARSFARRRDHCALAALMFAVTPAVWFFATVIEVHSLHLLVVSVCALVILEAPWHRPALVIALTASMVSLTSLSHLTAPILGPGWVMLAQLARSRRAPPFSLPALAGLGCIYLGALIVGLLITNVLRDKGMVFDAAFLAYSVNLWRKAFGLGVVWKMLISPYAFLVVVVPLAFWHARLARLETLAIASFLLPALAFFLWWGVPERGGYLLGPSIVAAISAALLVERGLTLRSRRFWIGLVLALQFAAGAVTLRSFDAGGFQLDERIERIERFLGGPGVVISANNNAPNAAIWLPEVREYNLRWSLASTKPGKPWLDMALPVIESLIGAGPAILDTSYRRREDAQGPNFERLKALEKKLEQNYRVTRFGHEYWPMWLLRAK